MKYNFIIISLKKLAKQNDERSQFFKAFNRLSTISEGYRYERIRERNVVQLALKSFSNKLKYSEKNKTMQTNNNENIETLHCIFQREFYCPFY